MITPFRIPSTESKLRTTYNVLNKPSAPCEKTTKLKEVSLEYVTYLSRPEWLQIMHYKIRKEKIHYTLHRAKENVVTRRVFHSLQLAVLEDLTGTYISC